MPAPRRRSPLALLCLTALTGCTPEPIIARSKRGTEPVTVLPETTVGPRGARIAGGDVEVDIPAGALPVDTKVSVQKVPRGGSKTLALHPTALGVSAGCAQLRPQGDYLYVLEPQSLVFAREVRVGIAAPGGVDGITALTLDGASTGANGYASSGQKASVRLRDFSAAIDIQTLTVTPAAVYAVSCNGTGCTATSGAGQATTCTPSEPGFYLCQGPVGEPSLAAASSLTELESLMPSIAAGQGAACSAPVVPPAPSCTDGAKNSTESDVDCGGPCSPCADTKACGTAVDCVSGVCTGNVCAPAPTCADGAKNGLETDQDCGGTCAPCADGKACGAPTDCASGLCNQGLCAAPAGPSCTDGSLNGDETALDCGGSCATRCGPGLSCKINADCASAVCTATLCDSPSCTDGAKNSTESDVDCGGPCPNKCADTKACGTAADCVSGVCTGNVCQAPGCTDGVKNGQETDADCGGVSGCGACALGKSCTNAVDCTSEFCTGGVCVVPACSNGTKDAAESDVDCGGPCAPCADTKACGAAIDCASGVCTGNVCQAATCSDGAKNGPETDTDCGGTLSCEPCADGKACAAPTDCFSHVCSSGACATPSCTDGAANGGESDVDCGGPCGPCANGKACAFNASCQSGYCTSGGVCATPACPDGAKNGDETDLDCGGSCAIRCNLGQQCLTKSDCATGFCLSGTCVAGTRVFLTNQAHAATFGSAAMADAVCQGAATAAQLGGTWLSWTSDASTSPAVRFSQPATDYKLLDGTVVASGWTDLTDGTLAHAIDLSELGTPLVNAEVWTSTGTAATIAGDACVSWTSNQVNSTANIGLSDRADEAWTNAYVQTCERVIRLYCFEQ